MIIIDAMIAGVLAHFFGTKWITVLGITCLITFLRMSLKVSNFIDVIYQAAMDVYSLNDKEEMNDIENK